jgi:hypothetical protein
MPLPAETTRLTLEWESLLGNLAGESRGPASTTLARRRVAERLAKMEGVIAAHYGEDLDETSVEAGAQMERDRWTPRLRRLVIALRERGHAQAAMDLEEVVEDLAP